MRSAIRQFDVFNGDADGICALHQLRLEQPAQATLITGRKREIALLERVQAEAGDRVTVLDISLARNRAALDALLLKGVSVDYFDHHQAGELPVQPGLHAISDTTPDVCTGMLVDRFGPRRVVLTSIPLFALSLAALYFTPANIYVFYLLWALVPIAGLGLWPLGYLQAVAPWFFMDHLLQMVRYLKFLQHRLIY